jgi:hypothetical protein
MALLMLIAFTYLPGFVTLVFRGMPTVWRGRHRLLYREEYPLNGVVASPAQLLEQEGSVYWEASEGDHVCSGCLYQ